MPTSILMLLFTSGAACTLRTQKRKFWLMLVAYCRTTVTRTMYLRPRACAHQHARPH
jgi:hypothetical protein